MKFMIEKQERTARAGMQSAPISGKQSIEICNFLRGKKLTRAVAFLHNVEKKKEAVPFKRFPNGLGHKPGNMAAGRYPVKAAGVFLELLGNVKSNATNQGLTGELVITHIAANRASQPMRNRLKFRGVFKRTHLEVVVSELMEKSEKKTEKSEKKPKKSAPSSAKKD